MKQTLPLIVLLGCLVTGAHAANELPAACTEIRVQIQAVTGLVPTPDMKLLKHISTHQECIFSSAEVYRAAYGDRPLPPPESPVRRHHEDLGDD